VLSVTGAGSDHFGGPGPAPRTESGGAS
jgi:hypothetical protein